MGCRTTGRGSYGSRRGWMLGSGDCTREAYYLQAEEPLDLAEREHDERDRDREQHRHRDVEAVARETALLLRPHLRVPARAVVAVAQLDHRRVDGRVLLAHRHLGLRHA